MYQRAIRLAPRSSVNHIRAGIVLKQMKDYTAAAQAFERALALDPKNLEATRQLAVVGAINLWSSTDGVNLMPPKSRLPLE